jgi:hypothetical protein
MGVKRLELVLLSLHFKVKVKKWHMIAVSCVADEDT